MLARTARRLAERALPQESFKRRTQMIFPAQAPYTSLAAVAVMAATGGIFHIDTPNQKRSNV